MFPLVRGIQNSIRHNIRISGLLEKQNRNLNTQMSVHKAPHGTEACHSPLAPGCPHQVTRVSLMLRCNKGSISIISGNITIYPLRLSGGVIVEENAISNI